MQTNLYNPHLPIITDDILAANTLRRAYRYAWTHSIDPSTKVGAIIIPIIGDLQCYGANVYIEGAEITPNNTQDRDWRMDNIHHAETSAIYYAARSGIKIEGATMYMPWIPCDECAKAIIGSGIKTLIGHLDVIVQSPERWWESLDKAKNRLEKAGINQYLYNGKLGGVKSLFNGNIWEP